MIMPACKVSGTVTQVLDTPDPGHFRSSPVPALHVDLRGIPGGRHYGFTRPAGARERWYKTGTEIRSGRQLTIMCMEELEEIARRMELPRVEPGWLGANVVIKGVQNFTLLPWGTRIFLGNGAVLVNEGINAPCRYAGQEVAIHFPHRNGLDLLFPRAAQNLRGIVASVECAGTIEAGATAQFKVPQQRLWGHKP